MLTPPKVEAWSYDLQDSPFKIHFCSIHSVIIGQSTILSVEFCLVYLAFGTDFRSPGLVTPWMASSILDVNGVTKSLIFFSLQK